MSRYISILSFIFLIAIGAHLLGLYSAYNRWSNYDLFKETVAAIEAREKIEDSNVPPDDLATLKRSPQAGLENRFVNLDQNGPKILVNGGLGLFKELCGEPGCLAVAYNRDGTVHQKWPIKTDDIVSGGPEPSVPYSYSGQDKAKDFSIVGIQSFENGDLLVSLLLRNAFPYGYGLMRVDSEGNVIWRKRDFYHHWATVTDEGDIYTPYYEIRQGERYSDVRTTGRPFALCPSHEIQYADLVRILDENGEILQSIDLVRLFLEDPTYNFLLSRTVDRCDPLHLNYVDVAQQADAENVSWLEKGDMLVSMRALSAVAIISADGKRIKRVYTGSFSTQHSAQFAQNGEVYLFDNTGTGANSLPSRIVSIDLSNGAEKIIHARSASDQELLNFTLTSGNISISPDGKRVLATYSKSGHVAEIDIESGKILSQYEHTHSTQDDGTERLYRIFGAYYYP